MILKTNEISKVTSGEWENKNNLPSQFDSSLITTDSRKIQQGAFFVAIVGEKFDGHDFISEAEKVGASAVCASSAKIKKISLDLKLPILIVQDTISAYQKIANLNRNKRALPLIAITGTCGKTSAKEFLKTILSEYVGENSVLATEGNTNNLIGVPFNLLKINEKHKYAVIEFGTNHFGEIETLSLCAEPDIAVVTSIGRGHLEFFKDVSGVATEKASISKGLKPEGCAIIPEFCEFRNILLEAAKNKKKELFSTEKEGDADLSALSIASYFDSTEAEFFWKKSGFKKRFLFPVPGKHQLSNAAAAALAASAVGVPPDIICSALTRAKLSGMRLRKRELNGVLFVNDAYNSNPESAVSGLQWFSETVPRGSRAIIFLGDMLELGEKTEIFHSELLSKAFEIFPSSSIITVGPIMRKAIKITSKMPLEVFDDSIETANFAKQYLREGDVVYLKGSRGMKLEEIENHYE